MSSLPDYRPHELMYDKNITDSEFDDFIGVWKNFMPRPLCEDICEFVDTQIDLACVVNPSLKMQEIGVPNHVIKSEDLYGGQLNRNDFAMVMNYADRDLCLKINSVLRTCVKHYMSEYQSLMNTKMISSDIKIQKTPPGGGYHLWHYENAAYEYSCREVTWMIYLNDVDEGGETEFRFQKRRIKPTQGTVVLFPAAMTHVHKGNMNLSEHNKYIVTGWFAFNE